MEFTGKRKLDTSNPDKQCMEKLKKISIIG